MGLTLIIFPMSLNSFSVAVLFLSGTLRSSSGVRELFKSSATTIAKGRRWRYANTITGQTNKHIQSLYSCAEDTLAFLNYTSDAADDIGDHRESDCSMLHKFKALKILRISRVLLISRGSLRRLIDELPSLLEELEIVERISAAEAQQTLDGMLAMKRVRYPNLRLITFEGVIPLDHDQIVAYERTGLVLDRRNTDTNTMMKTGQKWFEGIECERCQGARGRNLEDSIGELPMSISITVPASSMHQ